MAGVEAEQLLVADRVAEVKLVRADDVALRADAEELALDRVEVVLRIELLGEDLVERLRRAARAAPLRSIGRVLVAVGNPDVGDARRARAPGRSPRRSGGRRCRARSRTRGCPRRGCASVKPSAAFGCEKNVGLKSIPIFPLLAQSIQPWKCSGASSSRSTRLAADLGVDRVQVEPMRAGDQRERLFEIGAQLVRRARLAGIVAGDRQAAAELFARVLEAADVVALPAVERDRNRRQPLDRRVGVDAERRVTFLGGRVGRLDRCCRSPPRCPPKSRYSLAHSPYSASGVIVTGPNSPAGRTGQSDASNGW